MNTLYTIGYSGWKPEQIAATVAELGAVLWDIRRSPWSRAPQWRQPALRQLLGPAYVHMAPLGNVNYNTDGPIQLANPQAAVDPARAVLQTSPIILLCGCKEAETCHRSDAAAYLAWQLGGLEIVHLMPQAAGRTAPVPAGFVFPECDLPEYL